MSELGAPAPVMADPGAGTDGEGRVWKLCQMTPLTALDSQRLLEVDEPGVRLARLAELCDALAGDLSLLLGGHPGGHPT